MGEMAQSKALTIGYFNSINHQEWTVFPMRGAMEAARALGVNVLSFCGNTINTHERYDEQGNIIYELAMGGALDGAIIWKGNFTLGLSDAQIIEFCTRIGVPVVTIEGAIPGFPAVVYDNYSIMKVAVNHLIDVHGIVKIGFLGLAPGHHAFSERFRAYRDVLDERGIPYNEAFIRPWGHWESLNDEGKTNAVLDAWLREAWDSGMRGLVGSCDPTAAWALERLSLIGLTVPQDVAVVGFDGFMQGKTAVPSLSSVRPSWEQLGELAVRTIVKMVNGEAVPAVNTISWNFVVSQSCGCVDKNVTETGRRKNDPGVALELAFGKAFDPRISRSVSVLENALWAEVAGGADGFFIKTLYYMLNESIRVKREVFPWQDVISFIRDRFLGRDLGSVEIEKLETLCHQGRVAVSNAIALQKDRVLFNINDWIIFENELFQKLASTFDVGKIVEILIQTLPRLGIRECYMSLYENPALYHYPDPAPEWSRLVLALGGNKSTQTVFQGLTFRSCDIIPTDLLLAGEARSLLILPLYFELQQLGFIIFRMESDLLNTTTYNLLASQISAGIRGALLINELLDKDSKLELALSDLKTQHVKLGKAAKMLTDNQRKLIASEKMASLGRLTAGIAHELNTPLATLRASIEIIKDLIDEYADSIDDPNVKNDDHRAIVEDMRKHVASALASAQKSTGFIRGIKGQTLNLATRPSARFAASPVIRDGLLLLDFVLKRRRCALSSDIDESIELYGDPNELGQILTNLVNNAVDACVPGEGRISVSLRIQKKDEAVLTVADNGSGIVPGNLSKIFDPMFTTKAFGEGTGLGLSIVHELVEKFRGQIDVASEPGKTVFSVTFPAVK